MKVIPVSFFRLFVFAAALSFCRTLPGESQLFFDASGTDQGAFGPNQIITVSGGITFHKDCTSGIKDSFTTAADIYILRNGTTVGGKLKDVSGAPNTVLGGGGGGFFERVIAATKPQGSLLPGEYDVIIDECQDGVFDPNVDFILGGGSGFAFSVVIPTDVPSLPNAEIGRMKATAKQEALKWVEVWAGLELIKEINAFLEAAGAATDPIDFGLWLLGQYAQHRAGVDDAIDGAIEAAFDMVKMNSGLFADPPDNNFQELVTLPDQSPLVISSAEPLDRAAAAFRNATQQQSLLAGALLKALEKYQGAQQASDGYWALAHAREIKMYAGLLADQMDRTRAALSAMRSAVQARAGDLDQLATGLQTEQTNVRTADFTLTVRKILLGAGLDDAGIVALRNFILQQDFQFSSSAFLSALDELSQTTQDAQIDYRDLATAMDATITTLSSLDTVERTQPTANAGGPYSGAVGASVAFNAGASTDPNEFPLTFAWDLDGDGQFDDAADTNATRIFTAGYSGYIGVIVTNTAGKSSVAYAFAQVTDTNRAPVFQSLSPAVGIALVAPGGSLSFQASATDPDGDTVTIEWLVDGNVATSGATFNYQPGGVDAGLHDVTVRAGDGRGGVTTHFWLTAVVRPVNLVNLAVSQTHQPAAPQVGKDIVYTVTVTNAGPDGASGVVVVLTNLLPSNVTFVTATASQGSTAQDGTNFVANLGALTNGGSASLKIVLNAAAVGTFTHTANVSANEGDIDTADNHASDVTHITDAAAPLADLSVNQTASPSPVTVSNLLNYTVTVKNRGPNAANGVVLTEALAPGLVFISANPTPAAQDGNTLTFNLGSLANSSLAQTTVSIVVQPTNAAFVTSVATVTANEGDPDPGNNQAGLTTTVNPPSPNFANLGLALSVSTNVVPAGESLTYTLVVTNQGPDTATGVTAINTLPSSVVLLSATSSQGTASTVGGMVTGNLGTLTNGGSAQMTLVVKTLFAGPIADRASVAASERDTDSTDNTASVSVTVANSTNGTATVAVVRNFDDPEITQLQGYLAEMGLVSQVFDQAGLTFDALKNFKLIIWDDLSYAAGGLTANDVDVFQAAFNARIPLYFIGDDLALSATYALEGTPQKTNWVNLIHLNATTVNFGGNRTFSIVNQTHPVVNGPFGLVGDSNYGLDPDATTRTGTGEILLGVSGPHDVLVAFKDPATATKSVTQNVLPITATDAAGIAEKKKLFKNAVTWLLAKDPVADLALFSIAVPDHVTVGNTLTLRLTVKNNGPDQAGHVVLNDTLPAGLMFVSSDPMPSSQIGNTLTFDLGDVANASGTAASIGIRVKPTMPGTFANIATVSHNGDDPNPANNSSSAPFTVLPASPFNADLAVSQTASSNIVRIGDQFVYMIAVTNQGPDTANQVVLIDALPIGVTFVSANPSQGSASQVENAVVAQLGTLAAGAGAQVTITVQAGTAGVIANLATVSGDAGDLNGANNSASLQTLVLVRSGGPGEVVSYQSPGWRYKILGTGDAPPAGFEQFDFDDASWATGASAFGNRGPCPLQTTVATTWPTSTRLLVRRELSLPCPVSGLHIFIAVDNDVEAVFFNGVRLQTGNTHDGCPSQDNFRFDVPTALIRPGRNIVAYQVLDRGGQSFFDSRILTDAPIAADDAVADFSSAQNPNDVWSYGYSTTRGTPFNLDTLAGTNSSLALEAWSGTASGPHIFHNFSGVTQTYSGIIQPPDLLNLDPSFDGRNVVVRWTAPAAGTYEVQGRFQGLDSTTTDAAVLLNSSNTLFSANINGFGQTAPFDLPVTVAAGDQIDFSVGQGTGGSLFDSTGLSAIITRLESSATPVLSADLAITGAGPTNAITLGNVFSYILAVTNSGPDAASGAIVTTTLPDGIALISAATAQGAISQNGNVLTALLNTLSNGASATITLTATATAVGTLLNTASVTGNECDPNSADNQLAQSIIVNSSTADLAISANSIPAQVALGSLIHYSFVITNKGPQNADGVTFNDTLPAGIAFVSATASRGIVTHSATTVSGSLGTLTNGESVTINIVAQPTVSGTFTNRATVTSLVADPNTANNAVSQTTLVPTASGMADLAVNIRASAGVTAGQQVRYIVNVANAGPLAATGVLLTDRLPEGVTLVSASVPPIPPTLGGVLSFALGALDVGASTNVEIFVLTTTPGIATNSVSVTGNEADPSTENNSAALDVVISAAPAPSPDLSLAITASGNPIVLGTALTYTITVTNRSATTATGVVLSNTLPTDVNFVSANSSSGSAVHNGGTVLVNFGTLTSGAVAVLNVTTMPTNAEVLIAKADVSSVEPDANPADNIAFRATTVTNTAVADLALTLSALPDPATIGSNITYTIVVTNRGPSAATGVFITNQLALNATFVSATGGVSPNDGTLVFALGTLAAGNTTSVQFVITPTTVGTLTNVAGIFASESDPVGTNNLAVAVTTVGFGPLPPIPVDLSLSMTATPNPVNVGDPLTYSLTITNNSATVASLVVVSNLLPPDVNLVSVLPSQGTATTNAGTITVSLGNVANNNAATVAIVVVPQGSGYLTNQATVTSLETDSQPTNNTASVVTSAVVVQNTNLVLTILSSITLNRQTGLFEQGIRVSNFGNSVPSSVRVLISGLAANAKVFNASGTTNGTPFVQSNAPLPTGASVDFLLEYYVPTRIAPTNLTFTAEAGLPITPPPTNGTVLSIDRALSLSDGGMLIEFTAIPGRIYAIQYSSDMLTWRTAVPVLTAPANRVQWIDSGPPKTESKPSQLAARFYRVLLLSAN